MAIPVLETHTINDGGNTASTTLTLTKPTGVVSGDLLVLIGGNDSNQPAGSPEFTDNKTGWVFLGTAGNTSSDAKVGVFYRESDGTEGASETITTTTSNQWIGFYLRISGQDGTTPVDSPTSFTPAAPSATHAIPSITTTVNDCLAIYGLSFDGADGVPFGVSGTGWAQVDEAAAGTSANNSSGCFGTKDQATAGATGDATVTPNVTDGASFVQFAIIGVSTPAGDIVIQRRRIEGY